MTDIPFKKDYINDIIFDKFIMSDTYAAAIAQQESFFDQAKRHQLNILQHMANPMMFITFDDKGNKKSIGFVDDVIEKKKTFWDFVDLG